MSSSDFDTTPPLHVRLYGRKGCSLCADAAQMLSGLHGDFDFWVEKIDIDEDPAIIEKLEDHIPVVTFNGANRVQDPVSEEKLRRAFKKALAVEEKDHEKAAA